MPDTPEADCQNPFHTAEWLTQIEQGAAYRGALLGTDFSDSMLVTLDALALALHEKRKAESFAGCGWRLGSVVDGEALCPCPADAADILSRLEDLMRP